MLFHTQTLIFSSIFICNESSLSPRTHLSVIYFLSSLFWTRNQVRSNSELSAFTGPLPSATWGPSSFRLFQHCQLSTQSSSCLVCSLLLNFSFFVAALKFNRKCLLVYLLWKNLCKLCFRKVLSLFVKFKGMA